MWMKAPGSALGVGLACVLGSLLWSGSAAAAVCPSFEPGVSAGIVAEPSLVEASGLAASRLNPNVLWAHNDSGNPAELFALGDDGSALATYTLTGASNVDWEDLAIGPGPTADVDYLYVADIGDNNAVRSSVTVYRVPEPVVGGVGTIPLAGAVALVMEYPDGAHDAETLLADPLSGDLYIVTKSLIDGISGLYRYPFPHDDGSTVTLQLVGTHTFAGTAFERATTGGDISPDGSEMIVRTYLRAWLWQRASGSSVADALAQPPCEVPLESEPQGEAIAFAADGSGYYTVSESVSQPLYFFARMSVLPALSAMAATALVIALSAGAFFANRWRRAHGASSPA